MVKKKSRKLWWIAGSLVILTGLGVTGFVVMSRPKSEIDPSRLAAVERGGFSEEGARLGRYAHQVR